MNAINAASSAIADAVFAALSFLSPLGALLVLSAVSGVVMSVVFKYTSNQRALKRVADGSRASLLALKLFKEDLGVALRCQSRLLKWIGLRLLHSIPPMLVLMVPFVLILAQLGMRYEFAAAEVGQRVTVKAWLSEQGYEQAASAELLVPEGVERAPAAVRNPHDRSITWRIRAAQAGTHALQLKLDGQTVQKRFVARGKDGRTLAAVSPIRPGTAFWDRVLYPTESGFGAASPVQSIRLFYDTGQKTPVLGWDVHWLVTFFVVSMLCALLAKPFVKVQF